MIYIQQLQCKAVTNVLTYASGEVEDGALELIAVDVHHLCMYGI